MALQSERSLSPESLVEVRRATGRVSDDPRPSRPSHRVRSGFTLVELLIVVLLVAIIASIAVPAYQGLTSRARAARALGEINRVKVAAILYNTKNGRWPADVNRGIVPPELEPYLGDGFTFERDHYLLDWDNWSGEDGSPTQSGTGVRVGISLVTEEVHLGEALIELLGGEAARATIGEHYTFVIEATDS